ncbi:rhomboid family intramembrane serine protease [Bacillus infantis]|nr:rhomboid family intramembrane serine protease [Bacillus infantis]
MVYMEDYLFWRLAYFLIAEKDYRLVQMSKNQNEIWLEKLESKDTQVVRLLRRNLDWGNSLQRDIDLTAANGENIRKQVRKRELTILNIYITAYPPVDDYTFRLNPPSDAGGKTKVANILIDRAGYEDGLKKAGDFLGTSISFDLKQEYEEAEVENVKRAALGNAADKVKADKAVFNQGRPIFTYLFIFIQVAMFFWLEANGGSEITSVLIEYGAKYNPLILEGEWWRFFTPIVLHIGLLHLIMNTLALYYLGTAVERIYGSTRFLFIYILAGFMGALASFLFNSSVSAGASGAIFGCFGALLYFGLIQPKLFFRTMGLNILIVLGINLLFGFSVPGIDNAGHLGGLAGGFLAAGMVHLPKKRRFGIQLLFLVLASAVIYSGLSYGFSPDRELDEESVFVMAQEYTKNREYDKAYSLVSERVENSESSSAEMRLLLSYLELERGEAEKARNRLEELVAEQPDLDGAYYYLAVISYNEQDTAKAKEYAERAIELNPSEEGYRLLLEEITGNEVQLE